MIHRQRGERPQKRNPHKLTRDQHVIPAATLRRFAASDGLVEVHLRDGRIQRVPTDNQIFSVDRLWDQRAEAGYMKSVEDDFQALIDALEAGRVGPLSPIEHCMIIRFWSLWRWRNHFIDSPTQAQPLNGITPDNLSHDQREILESEWVAFIEQDKTLPARMVTGMRIQFLIDRDEVQLRERHWGILRASEPNLIIPDRPGSLLSIPASPRLLFAADNPDGELSTWEIVRANAAAIQLSRNYVIVPPH
jgi:hypothetical protein